MDKRHFIGRTVELERLGEQLEFVRQSGSGRMIAIRGRRQVGKSRLVEEFIRREGVNAVFYTASGQRSVEELRVFSEQIADSGIGGGAEAAAGSIGTWEAALTIAVTGASSSDPIVLVVDEFPFLIKSEPAIEGILQKQWDRRLEGQPVLVLLVGSDVSMMHALNGYGRPLYGRLQEMVINPLSPAALHKVLSLPPATTLDAYLVIGGFPRFAEIWRKGDTLWTFLKREVQNPESPLVVLGERSLNAEFPGDLKSRIVLESIGAGERVYTAILKRSQVSPRTLETTLDTLTYKQVVSKELPYSSQPRPKLSRYFVADFYLRFWLRFIRPAIPAIERGRGDIVYQRIRESWAAFAGRSIEPLIRQAIQTSLPDSRYGQAEFVGGFWNRDHSVEVDIIGGREQTTTDVIDFVGSIKWRNQKRFDRGDLSKLIEHRALIPGANADSLLIGVSKSGFAIDGLDIHITPEDVITAFKE